MLAPRIGFFTTPAFLEQWQTNVDNQFRLNTNQALIAALSRTFASGDPTEPNHLIGLDDDHAPVNSDCYGCHKNLDPMRNVFHNSFNPNNHRARRIPNTLTPDFAFQNHRVAVADMQEFANALAEHPGFAMAWTEKLCQWFSAITCDTSEPEMQRIAQAFANNSYNFDTLVRELVTSPLVTTTTFDDRVITPGSRVTIARGNHYCQALSERLKAIRTLRGLTPEDSTRATDLCEGAGNALRQAANTIPKDGVTRGKIELVQPGNNDLMLAKAYDGFCDRASTAVVGGNDTQTFDPSDSTTALDDMTEILLGIPSAANTYAAARSALDGLYTLGRTTPTCSDTAALTDAAAATNPTCGLSLSRTNALRLVWRTACQSPDLTGIGL